MGSEFNKWTKFGVADIYQTGEGVIVKHTDGLYYVFGKKEDKFKGKTYSVEVEEKKGLKTWYSPFNEYVGSYKSRAKALDVLNKVEKGRGGKILRVIKIDDKQVVPQFLHDDDRKHKGGVIIVQKGDEIGLAHELGHYKAGHATHNSVGMNTPFKDESDAVEEQIKILNSKGIYNKKARGRAIESLASHSNKPYQKKRRALKAVRNIEAKLGLI